MARNVTGYDNSLSAKWSDEIAEDGFTMVPNSLLFHYTELGLTPAEFLIIVNIESFRWEAGDFPYPTVETLSKRVRMETRTVTRHITRLHKHKRLIIRRPRHNTSNEYSFYPLISKLSELVRQAKIRHEKLKVSAMGDISGITDLSFMSAKEDLLNNKTKEHLEKLLSL